ALKRSKEAGISTPEGHGWQYPQPVQPTFMISRYFRATSAIRPISAAASDPGRASAAIARFSSTCASSFIPDKATVTSAWFQTHLRAHSAGVQHRSDSRQSASMAGGAGETASAPPRRGSIAITARPFAAAYFRPSVPACNSSSREVYLIWQNSHGYEI